MKFLLILGTRPEIIKLSPIIRECERLKLDYKILHTGQHYSYNMDQIFFEQLGLPETDFNLDIGSGTHAEQTGKMLIKIEKTLNIEKPDVVLVQGDTNTCLAGALAAAKLGISIAHVEAGLRSNDMTMPEEINRILVDHCSDFLFAPTMYSKQILRNEGISEDKIFVTGNTIVDAVYQNLELARKAVTKSNLIYNHLKSFALATVHRQENVDNKSRFHGIIEGLKLIQNELNLTLIYPIHPRSEKQLNRFNINTNQIKLIPPLDYLQFLVLEQNAKLILTDSGGVQEEACILGVPCVTLRDNTERPETLEVGANVIAGCSPQNILEGAKEMISRPLTWNNPFGDGKSGKRIIEILLSQ